MSASSISFYMYLSQQITIYSCIPTFILGVLGGFLSLIVFLSLRTFRESSCAFYLIVMSLANLIHLLVWLSGYIIINGFGYDWSVNSPFLCKGRFYLFQLCLLVSYTSICFAMIDQFLSTSSNPTLHRLCNIKLARYAAITSVILSLLHGIPFALYSNVISLSLDSSQLICVLTSRIVGIYFNFGFIIVLIGVLPLSIMIVFGLLTYYNIKNLAYRTVPLVRRELDKQLTRMVLVQVIFNSIVLLPYVIVFLTMIYLPSNNFNFFLLILCINLHTVALASPFYIYVCVSKRFRQQFKHVIRTLHTNRWRHPNQILPEIPNITINMVN
ncbi:unnamed protein product [Adineta ricciae]|uniref:G-protein coupled receptors family 1 profile domain-containing protein n=1 Tax=Adineta ricciae TaxID=249248 RepID=A0A815DCU6_ADIRI|nr:unnamed protein product [Adineta ricciae]CAF1296673.1 unnamed protein product [Adineta ricciae]